MESKVENVAQPTPNQQTPNNLCQLTNDELKSLFKSDQFDYIGRWNKNKRIISLIYIINEKRLKMILTKTFKNQLYQTIIT